MIPQSSWHALQVTNPSLQLAGIGNFEDVGNDSLVEDKTEESSGSFWDQASIWFAAPKSKVRTSLEIIISKKCV